MNKAIKEMKTLLNHTELRLLCSDMELNGNEYTTKYDDELRRLQRKLDNRLGETGENLNLEELRLLNRLCMNSKRHYSYSNTLTDMMLMEKGLL